MESRANYLLIGSVTLLTVAAAVIFGLWLADVILQEDRQPYVIHFDQSVTGLDSDSAVRLNGIRVGEVQDIRLDPAHPKRAVVTIAVDADVAIHADASASIEQPGLTGQRFVGIEGGSSDAPVLQQEDGQPPLIPSKVTGMAMLLEAAPDILDQVRTVTNRAARLFSEEQRQDVQAALSAIRDVSEQVAERDEAIGQTIQDAAATAQTLDRVSRRLLAVIEDVDSVVSRSDEAVASIAQASDEVQQMVEENRGPIREMTAQGSVEARHLINEARVLVDDLSRVAEILRENPNALLFGDRARQFQPDSGP